MSPSGLIRQEDLTRIGEVVRTVEGLSSKEIGGRRGRNFLGDHSNQSVIILNNTAATLNPFSIVRLGRGVTSNPLGNTAVGAADAINLESYVWNATKPDADLTGVYGVTQMEVKAGQRGRALISGVTKVRLDDTDEGEYANPQEDDFEYMVTADSGKFPVLVVETATDTTTWGYVLLGGATDIPVGVHFAVRVWQDGGTTDGDLTHQCNRTYTVRTLDATAIDTGGVLLGEDKEPVQKRPTLGTLVVPAVDGTGVVGVGYYDENGAFQLWSANEALGSGACA